MAAQPTPANVTAAFAAKMARLGGVRVNAIDDTAAAPGARGGTENVLSSLLAEFANGIGDVPTQRPEVQYLSRNRYLVLPSELGRPRAPVAAGANQVYLPYLQAPAQLCWQLTRLAIDNIEAIDVVANADNALQAAVDGTVVVPRGQTDFSNHPQLTLAMRTRGDGTVVSEADFQRLLAHLAWRMGLRIDPHDMGAMLQPGMTVRDGDYTTVAGMTGQAAADRLLIKLGPYTRLMIGALNMEPCGGSALAGMVRAYGVAMGLVPAPDTRLQSELLFTNRWPTTPRLEACSNLSLDTELNLWKTSINILSIFGLLHLSRHHTYRPNDVSLQRLAQAYLNTTRTFLTDTRVQELTTNMETFIRTAPHPFGLGGTYFLARLAARLGALSEALVIRVGALPPELQRLAIVEAAAAEWSSTPAGIVINEGYAGALNVVATTLNTVRADPPAHSALAALYGKRGTLPVPAPALAAANSMMAPVVGYAEIYHVDANNRKDGLALALSLENVRRDQRALVEQWKTMWDKHRSSAETGAIEDYVRKLLEFAQGAPAAAAVVAGAP